MKLKVLSLVATALLSNLSLCHSTESSRGISWIFPLPNIMPESRIGRQMPPYHEPDAVLINVGGQPGGNAPRVPRPGGPGVFIPNVPGVFGFPGMPGVYGAPGGTLPRPNGFGFPNFPNGFGAPGGFMPPRNPNGPGVFVTPRQDHPPSGPNAFDIPVGPNGHGFSVGTGVIGVPNEHSRPNDPAGFGRPNIFTVAGNGNGPVPVVPGFFVPGQNPNFPGATGSFPGNGGMPPGSFPGNGGVMTGNFPGNGGMVPETFIPGDAGRFGPGGTYPGAFIPEASPAPHNPGVPDNFGGSFPGKEFHGREGGREMNDDPVAEMFPIIDKETMFYQISS